MQSYLTFLSNYFVLSLFGAKLNRFGQKWDIMEKGYLPWERRNFFSLRPTPSLFSFLFFMIFFFFHLILYFILSFFFLSFFLSFFFSFFLSFFYVMSVLYTPSKSNATRLYSSIFLLSWNFIHQV